MSTQQLDLFTQREHRSLGAPATPNAHGVFQPDETFTLPDGRRCMPLAEIDLVHVDAFGWIYSTSYNLGETGSSSPLMLNRMARGDSRDDALRKAVERLVISMDERLQGWHYDGAGTKKKARLVRQWAQGLLA